MALSFFGRALIALMLLYAAPALSQPNQAQLQRQIESLKWQASPSTGTIASVAEIRLTGDLRFLGQEGTQRFLELNGNPPRPNQYTLAPQNIDWFAVFSYRPSGYVRDNEQLNPDELIRILQRNNESGFEERRRLGLPILRLVGWAVPPHYDLQTRRLEWGTRLVGDDGQVTVNYTIRLLGRSGVVDAVLVSSPQYLDEDIRSFKNALNGFDFVSGQRYSEFRDGDRVAEYGLAALIVGGAAAAAASSGALKGLGKFIGIAAVASVVAIGAFFKGIFRKK